MHAMQNISPRVSHPWFVDRYLRMWPLVKLKLRRDETEGRLVTAECGVIKDSMKQKAVDVLLY